MNGQPVAMRRVHVGLNLKYKAGKLIAERAYLAFLSHTRARRERKFQETFEERLHTEVVYRTAEEHGCQFAARDALDVEIIACTLEQLYFLRKLIVIRLTDHTGQRLVVD